MSEEIKHIKEVINKFQTGYIHRNIDNLDTFMDLFCNDELEIIGTGAYKRGSGEWCVDKKTVRKLIADDWESWGDLRLNTDQLDINIQNQTAWFATTGTVSRTIEPGKSYQNFIGYMKWLTENEPEVSSKEKLLDVLQAAVSTLAEADRGKDYIWPIRFSAVLVKQNNQWRFCQMTFSFPTIYPPDVRLTEF